MLITIFSPVYQTRLFSILLLFILLITIRRQASATLSKDLTAELKGFSILAIIFAHIGYYLAQDTRFLFPLSVSAGVGVNLFLFLSGYGLTHSMVHRPLSILDFYKKRLLKLFFPLWILLITLLAADSVFLHIHYPFYVTLSSFLGFFPKAHLYESINAPLWYFTFILFYYFLFPLVFFRFLPIISAVLLGCIGYFIAYLVPLPVDAGVLGSYQVHVYAFPLGALCAALLYSRIRWIDKATNAFQTFFERRTSISYILRALCLSLFLVLFCYTSLHADIGKGPWLEQRMSLFTMFMVLGIFLLKPIQSRFLILVGVFSYEIYLFHWPLLYRYDFLYKYLPASLATFTSIGLFLGIAYAFRYAVAQVNKRLS
jgi:peptidoglycan/LPS O-acetylase OafA/YrhL